MEKETTERGNGERYVLQGWGECFLPSPAIMFFYLQQALKRFRLSPFLFDQATMKFPDTQIDIGKLFEDVKNFIDYLQTKIEGKGEQHWAYWIITRDPILKKSLEKHETVSGVLSSYKRSLSYLEKFIYGETTVVSNIFLLERFATIAFDNAVALSK